ncbi:MULTISPECIES: non-oxidative hydroxyarylic acid decarboxylases subunit D [unclassified Sedimentibacter]|uniref:non-oxidative hydroxyarylic acid decarboxylases subunit D n=1 Tax=unclassified Sedimentibacter TaxID=2649220 RepID=UPI001BD50528|nr:non-oxidative hydroxyarylic acid decarboxylases subunit D [Sedimentibacter sp. MB35-C1]WMJ78532.1 non-oxidative hydroxyarylic acid decarboxylases subunit D [Sedimentibacter sp. MB35-C1]
MKCPRCESDKIKKITDAPKDNAWEVYVCEKCWYSWRSTENPVVIEKFKLDDEKIAHMGLIPPIPPLKK